MFVHCAVTDFDCMTSGYLCKIIQVIVIGYYIRKKFDTFAAGALPIKRKLENMIDVKVI